MTSVTHNPEELVEFPLGSEQGPVVEPVDGSMFMRDLQAADEQPEPEASVGGEVRDASGVWVEMRPDAAVEAAPPTPVLKNPGWPFADPEKEKDEMTYPVEKRFKCFFGSPSQGEEVVDAPFLRFHGEVQDLIVEWSRGGGWHTRAPELVACITTSSQCLSYCKTPETLEETFLQLVLGPDDFARFECFAAGEYAYCYVWKVNGRVRGLVVADNDVDAKVYALSAGNRRDPMP